MSSNMNDPNNHVPEVSPGDDWDELDADSGNSNAGLPPRRPDRGLPPKKMSNGRMTTPVRIGQTDPVADHPKEQESGKVKGTKPEVKKNRKTGITKKAAAKTGVSKKKATPRTAVGKKTSTKTKAGDATAISEPDREPVQEGGGGILPMLQPGSAKRFSHRIGTGESNASDGPSQQPFGTPKMEIASENSPMQERSRTRTTRGERIDWGKVKTSNRWIVYTGLAVVLLVVLLVTLSQLAGEKSGLRIPKSFYSQLETAAAKEKDDPEMMELLTSTQEEAKIMYARYMTAGSLHEISKLLYNGETILPVLEDNWKPGNVPKGWNPGDDTRWTVIDRDGERFGILMGTNPDFTPFSAYFRKEGGDLKIDWKATTGFGSSGFDELRTGKGDGSEIRTMISLADFYTFSLPEEKYRSFRLLSPDGDSNLWAYTEAGSELDQKLLELFAPGEITGEAQNETQVLLSLKPGPDDALPNQWMIKDLLRTGWLEGLKE